MGTHKIPKVIKSLSIPERMFCNVLAGFLSAAIPQYIVKGNEIIPTQVINVPSGIELSSSNAIVSKGEPVNKSTITLMVKIREI